MLCHIMFYLADGSIIKAHALVLSSRSQLLSETFHSTATNHNQVYKVNTGDISRQTWLSVLRFMYLGRYSLHIRKTDLLMYQGVPRRIRTYHGIPRIVETHTILSYFIVDFCHIVLNVHNTATICSDSGMFGADWNSLIPTNTVLCCCVHC